MGRGFLRSSSKITLHVTTEGIQTARGEWKINMDQYLICFAVMVSNINLNISNDDIVYSNMATSLVMKEYIMIRINRNRDKSHVDYLKKLTIKFYSIQIYSIVHCVIWMARTFPKAKQNNVTPIAHTSKAWKKWDLP